MQIYLDNASTTPLSGNVKSRLLKILDRYGNPSSLHSAGEIPRQIITGARQSVARFIRADAKNIYFTPSGSASNTLAVRGLISEDPRKDPYEVFYSPTSHKSMLKVCEACNRYTPLEVNSEGKLDLFRLETALTRHSFRKPLVCVEAANSEFGTINDIAGIGRIVHGHNGILIVDATGYIPSCRVDMESWEEYTDILTFSGHKLHALKGIGILWKKESLKLKPLIYGSQQDGIVAGTENVLGIASLGMAVDEYDYSSVSPDNRDHVYDYMIRHIPDWYLIGAPVGSGDRLPHNLYACFRGVEGESLMLLLDRNGIRVSTGSACNSGELSASAALTAIGMRKEDIHSCIRFSFSGQETKEELNYVCDTLKQCVAALRCLL
ncbi:MAG: cysteine desulfurase [Acetatifactor sp.]|nr:cysteine desulfurase [Acetatifactor sp.]